MIYPYILILTIGFVGCFSRQVSPSLLPTSVEKTIHRFNYCLNQIKHPKIFQSLNDILIGKARDEFRELGIIFSKLRPGQNTGSISSSSTSSSTSTTTSSTVSTSSTTSSSVGVNSRKFKKELELYTLYARSLKIKILSVQYDKKKAVAETIFFDSYLILEERKRILLEYVDQLWKIKEIIAISVDDVD